jgi:hypothetical protein
MSSTEDPLGARAPGRILLVEHDPRGAVLIGEMLRSRWVDGLVLSHAEQLGDAAHEGRPVPEDEVQTLLASH